MEEELQSQALKRERLSEIEAEIRELTNLYERKLDLQERMTTWCTDLLEDLLLIDSSILELSRYRRPIHEMRVKIENCWHRIVLCYDRINRDLVWLRQRVDDTDPELDGVWWLIQGDLKRRQIYIRDRFIDFFEVNVQFRELIVTYSEIFREDPHFIFGRYRHFD